MDGQAARRKGVSENWLALGGDVPVIVNGPNEFIEIVHRAVRTDRTHPG